MQELVHHLDLLKKRFSQMHSLRKCSYFIKEDLEQVNLQSNNPGIFLQLFNYCLIDYSRALYMQVINQSVTIKLLNDRQFVQEAFKILQRVFNLHPALSTDQFLTNRYLSEKVALLAQVAGLAIQFQRKDKEKKKSKKAALQNQGTFQQQPPLKVDVKPIRLIDQPLPLPKSQLPAPAKLLISNLQQQQFGSEKYPRPVILNNQSQTKKFVEVEQMKELIQSVSDGLSQLVDKFEQLQREVREGLAGLGSRVDRIERRLAVQ